MSGISGDHGRLRYQHGSLEEYAEVDRPLRLEFEFNPAAMTRTRSVSLRNGSAPGALGGYDFANRGEVPRASQGISLEPESFTVTVLFDATDRMNAGDGTASRLGVQPELDTLRSMLEPKVQGADGQRTLAALGQGGARAFARHQFASVLLFRWGPHHLPVFMTQAEVEISDWLPSLYPYRSRATLTLQVIESRNEFYGEEIKRQFRTALRQEEAQQVK